ncbi:cbb3-type cytochrome c oxidase subunit 3 [Leptospira sarikeiensis]|uniref:Cbb3-type cytochrome c oxidase subunit 3 n=1 Tax=Leptospira sarikeiensis TaxID=2484943 RepID=A0A4R9K2L9_9LEPT|nr:cbb3-type cytochrome c oxidase subunit 3 [Leptospira sarikeiensis]TGL58385.1 cbb3-type cytochrome c oxidase subunit 3 [Leptospira sarikeiensis]
MDLDTLQIYKSLRLPILFLSILIISLYVYRNSRKERMEKPKFRMLEED